MNVLDTVQKLLNLTAARGATAAEAAAAAAAAQRLVAKHRLGEGAKATTDGPNAIRWFADAVLEGDPPPWRLRLLMRIAHLNDCEVLRSWPHGGRRSQFTLVGTETDVAVTRSLYAYLERAIDRLVKRFGPGLDPVWRDNFRFGAIDAIEKRLVAALFDVGPMALARADHRQRVRDVAASVARGASASVDTSGPLDVRGRSAGAAAGRNVALDGLPVAKDEVA